MGYYIFLSYFFLFCKYENPRQVLAISMLL